jgi:hypothetical protein
MPTKNSDNDIDFKMIKKLIELIHKQDKNYLQLLKKNVNWDLETGMSYLLHQSGPLKDWEH